VQEEPPQKLLGGDRHKPLLSLVGIILPAERDLAVGKVHDPVVRDGNAMCIARQVVEDMFRSTEGSLGVDHPILTKQRAQKGMEGFLFAESFEATGEQQFAVTESLLESGDELAAKDTAQHLYRQEEWVARLDPALVIGRETAGGNYAVDVRVMLEILPPGVEDTQEADLCAKVLWIGGDLQQGCAAGSEQEVVDDFLFCKASHDNSWGMVKTTCT